MLTLRAAVWATLKAALKQRDTATLRTYLEAAEITVANPNLTSFYDVRGKAGRVPS